jgi:hypothetical protein
MYSWSCRNFVLLFPVNRDDFIFSNRLYLTNFFVLWRATGSVLENRRFHSFHILNKIYEYYRNHFSICFIVAFVDIVFDLNLTFFCEWSRFHIFFSETKSILSNICHDCFSITIIKTSFCGVFSIVDVSIRNFARHHRYRSRAANNQPWICPILPPW